MQVIEKYLSSDKETKDFYIAFFLSLACILSYLEGFIPKPVPAIKPGLSNAIPLIFITYSLYKEAIFISISKVFIVSLFGGYIFSPMFYMGLAGSLASVFMMCSIHLLLKKRVSEIGISLCGAFFHISAQILIAYIVLPSIKTGLFFLTGILLTTSFIAGIITALFAIYLKKHL